jgi:hypothetical protein
MLAVKTFLKGMHGKRVLLLLDNTTAVAYINNMGGTVSAQVTLIARDLWMWCLERDILLSAQHLPGVENTTADRESRKMRDRSDWMIDPSIFSQIQNHFPGLEIDLFASRLTTQLPRFFSWRPDPLAERTDAFLQDWTGLKAYANPPWNLVGRVLLKVEEQTTELVLVAPVWPSQPWYPRLLSMLVEAPLMIPHQDNLMWETREGCLSEVSPQLAVWPISGNTTQSRSFQEKLRTSCSHHGGIIHPNPTTPCVANGLAGALNGIQIPFQAL